MFCFYYNCILKEYSNRCLTFLLVLPTRHDMNVLMFQINIKFVYHSLVKLVLYFM